MVKFAASADAVCVSLPSLQNSPALLLEFPVANVSDEYSCFVYVLSSLVNGKRYVGIARDPIQRLQQHNARKVRSTKHWAPYVLVYQELLRSCKEAREREIYFKSAAGRRFLDKVIQHSEHES